MFQYLDNIIFILSFVLTVIIYHKELLNIFNDSLKMKPNFIEIRRDKDSKKKSLRLLKTI